MSNLYNYQFKVHPFMKTDFTWHDIRITALKVHVIIITGLNGPGITITVFNWHDIMHACLNEYSVTISGLNSNGIMIKWKKIPNTHIL